MNKKISYVLVICLLLTCMLPATVIAKENSGLSNWAKTAVVGIKKYNLGFEELFKDYKKNITREEFTVLAVKLYERANGEISLQYDSLPFTDIEDSPYKDYIMKAYKIGIAGGVGNNKFAPKGEITREQIATLFYRLIKVIFNKDNYEVVDDIDFTDENEISPWAKDAVLYLYKNDIMKGIGKLDVGPKTKTTREQAMALVYRVATKKNIAPKLIGIENFTNYLNNDQDSDKDGLSDFQEKYKYFTDPNNADSDGDGIIDSDWDERKEFTYTITAILRISHLHNLQFMNNDYQDARIIGQKNNYVEYEVVLYPENTVKEGIKGNKDWKNYKSDFSDYLKPYIYANWDEAMKKDLIGELEKEGIYVNQLSDKELVQKVSLWIRDNYRNISYRKPAPFYVHYDENGNFYVDYKFRNLFDEKIKEDKNMTDEEVINSMVLGKGMYYNKTRGGCTSSATLAATIYRALGIPTRHVITTKIRLYDRETLAMLENIKNPIIKKIFEENNKTDSNHFFNEVYINGRWVRIDYAELGNDNSHADRGIYFQHYIMNDMSDIDLAGIFGEMTSQNNWGPFKTDQIYKLLSLSDQYGKYYTPRYDYGININEVDKYYTYGSREFCRYVSNNLIEGLLKVLERGKGGSGSISCLEQSYFDDKSLIIISPNISYYRLPEQIRDMIAKQEYETIEVNEYKTFKVGNATILIIKPFKTDS